MAYKYQLLITSTISANFGAVVTRCLTAILIASFAATLSVLHVERGEVSIGLLLLYANFRHLPEVPSYLTHTDSVPGVHFLSLKDIFL